uniref:chloroplast envelope membrane protein n=1 Tax=Solanum ternatum TaxID=743523 RepID=UPI001FCD7C37|nr:chloroplast envelope membrane protein [Solanum ternatum]UNZ88487.1 chloroplast envelope membrane protein [Solanum ternatum]
MALSIKIFDLFIMIKLYLVLFPPFQSFSILFSFDFPLFKSSVSVTCSYLSFNE